MSWNLVRLGDATPAPWRNGGGVTRELLAWPDAAAWKVRMSVANVEQDGPFSRFDGVQRWFAVLEGAGVRLRLGGAAHTLTSASEPLSFDGGVATDCELPGGPTQDFNLMLQACSGRMERLRGDTARNLAAPDLIAIYTHGTWTSAVFANEKVVLEPKTLAWRILDAGGPLQIETQDALWMEIKR
jgi:environmental stress-induced protein Ves